MKFTKKFTIAALVILAAIILGAMLGDKNCCEKPDPEVRALLASAEHGDLEAVRALYKRAASDGVAPMAEYWALKGALAGDREMRLAYVEIFRTKIDPVRQQKVRSSIQQKSNMPGTPCLLAQLSDGTSVPNQCN